MLTALNQPAVVVIEVLQQIQLIEQVDGVIIVIVIHLLKLLKMLFVLPLGIILMSRLSTLLATLLIMVRIFLLLVRF